MSLPAAALRKMLEMGLTLEQAVEIAEVCEAESQPAEPVLSKGALRTRKWREAKAASVTEASPRDVTETRHGDVSHVGEPAQVVKPTSSLRSEDTQEDKSSFVDTPSLEATVAPLEKPKTKPPKAVRGTRLPEDWEPSADEFDLGRQAGLTDEEITRAALEFRNYWCSRSRDATKLSWRATWHNRVNELGDRKRERGARLAVAATQPRGGRRGATSFADIYAERHGQGSG